MRLAVATLATLAIATSAHAETRGPDADTRAPAAARAQLGAGKQPSVMHYRMLEKMLRRFSTLAGEARDARTRG